MTGYNYNTDDIEYSTLGLSVGRHKVMITGEEFVTKKPENPNMLVLTFQSVQGDEKGKEQRAYYNHQHSNKQVAAIARESIKRIADATGKAVSSQSPLKGRVLQIEVRPQKANSDYNEVWKYLPEDYSGTDGNNNDIPN